MNSEKKGCGSKNDFKIDDFQLKTVFYGSVQIEGISTDFPLISVLRFEEKNAEKIPKKTKANLHKKMVFFWKEQLGNGSECFHEMSKKRIA